MSNSNDGNSLTLRECAAGSETLLALWRDFLNGRMAAAVLLIGESGVGKRTFARLLSQALMCTSGEDTEKKPCGQFMKFDYLTMVPFDLEAVLPEQMSDKERARLNAYHKRVFETIGPLLNEEERSWLKEATREI